MEDRELEFTDDKLFVHIPVSPSEGIYKTQLIMTKEIFQECYKRWIKPQGSEVEHEVNSRY